MADLKAALWDAHSAGSLGQHWADSRAEHWVPRWAACSAVSWVVSRAAQTERRLAERWGRWRAELSVARKERTKAAARAARSADWLVGQRAEHLAELMDVK